MNSLVCCCDVGVERCYLLTNNNEGELPGLVTWIICHRWLGGILATTLFTPVHTLPAFVECCLSAPSSAKEMLTAINYLAGWTEGIPLCLNTAYMHTPMQGDTTWPPSLWDVWQMSLNVLSFGVVHSLSSLAEDVMSHSRKPRTHTQQADMCLCLLLHPLLWDNFMMIYTDDLWWEAVKLWAVNQWADIPDISLARHVCNVWVCLEMNYYALSLSVALVSTAPASAWNTMWFSCRCWLWGRGGALASSACL